MTGFSNGQIRSACVDAGILMEKTVAEEELTVDEQKFLDEHLENCPKCQVLEKLAFGLPIFAEASNVDHDAHIAAVLERLHQQRQSERRIKLWFGAVAACLIVAVSSVLVWKLNAVKTEPALQLASQCDPSDPATPVNGVWTIYCKGAELETTVENGEVRMVLREGAIAVFVDPLRKDKKAVTVETQLGLVNVKGTLFSVHVKNDDALVQVYRGIVEVTMDRSIEEPMLSTKKGSVSVNAGNGLSLKHQNVFECDEPTANTPVQAILDSVLNRDISPNVGIADNTTNSTKVSESQIEQEIDSEENVQSESSETVHRDEKHGRVDTSRRSNSMNALIQDAQSCLLVQDWDCAALKYKEVLNTYSRRPESAAALISLAKIELRHLKLPNEALARYNKYLERLPNGPLAEEAWLGIAEAYRRLRQKAKEMETLQTFLKKYPESSSVGKVRNRLNMMKEYGS